MRLLSYFSSERPTIVTKLRFFYHVHRHDYARYDLENKKHTKNNKEKKEKKRKTIDVLPTVGCARLLEIVLSFAIADVVSQCFSFFLFQVQLPCIRASLALTLMSITT